MKPRRIMVMLEVTTTATMFDLRNIFLWRDIVQDGVDLNATIHQVQVKIVKPPVKK